MVLKAPLTAANMQAWYEAVYAPWVNAGSLRFRGARRMVRGAPATGRRDAVFQRSDLRPGDAGVRVLGADDSLLLNQVCWAVLKRRRQLKA
jgi:hypothetical protein